VNGIWTICEESYWGVPAHLSMQHRGYGLPDPSEPTVDLFVAETGNLLAWAIYFLGEKLDQISPLVSERVQLELEKRILDPCFTRNDFWWMGFRPNVTINNWNPWVNSNWLTVVLLNEKNESRRIESVSKIMRSLDVFINSYPEDGGCDEGPNYWNRAAASLFDCLELLYSATNGRINVYQDPLIQEMGRYIYRVHIADRYFINFADASAKVNLESDLAFRFGKRIGDERLQAFGTFFSKLQQKENKYFSGSIGRQLPAIFNFDTINAAPAEQPLLRDVWMPGIQVMTARSHAGTAKGLYVAAKGGHNAESHNHNDIGNFIIYLDGLPMIIDVGVETYTKKTFSTQRYEIWTMQSVFHNLPTIDGVMQRDGREHAASDVSYSANEDFAELKLDVAAAYPAEAGINQWLRTVRLNRGKDIQVIDDFDLKKQTQKIQMTLMTACEVELIERGRISLKNSSGSELTQLRIEFDSEKLKADFEKIKIEDENLKAVWGDQVTRILLTSKAPTQKERWILRFLP
ncbi:heparinase II/III-family protein, partial [candidate division KSB1 bacterium]|nr:heparinase II/III-family protein [candidate division KSB1 bacterium]